VVTTGIEAAKGPLLDDMLLTELSKRTPRAIRLIGARDVTAVLGMESQKQLAGCTESSCLIEIGNALGASHLLSVSLGRIGKQVVLNGTLLDVKHADAVYRDTLYLGETEDALIDGVRKLATGLVASSGWRDGAAWTGEVSLGNAAAAAADSASKGAAAGPPWVLIGGITAGAGVLAAAGLGATALLLNDYVEKNRTQQDVGNAAVAGIGALVGSGVGGAAALGGCVMLAIGLFGQGE
jgi:hypothetical protein